MSETRARRPEPDWEEPYEDEAPREVHLSEYWQVVWKRRRLVGLCVGAALVAAALASLLSRPTYRATVVLNVERDRASVLDISSAGPLVEGHCGASKLVSSRA